MKQVPWLFIRITLGVFLGGIVLYFLFKRVSPSTLLTDLTHADTLKVFLAAFFIGLSYVCRAALWKALMGRFRAYRYGPVFRSTAVGYLANNILPVRLGDPIRGTFLYVTQGGGAGFIFGSLVLERVLDVSLIVALLAVLSFSMQLHYAWLVRSTLILAGLVILFFVGVALLTRAANRKVALPGVIGRLNRMLSRFIPKGLVLNLGESMGLANTRRGLAWLLATWFITYWGLYFTLDALGLIPVTGIPQVALILGFSSLGLAVPSLPASLGTYQAAFVFGAVLAGARETDAISASFLYQALWVVITSGLGLISMAWDGTGFRKLLPEALRRGARKSTELRNE